MPSRWALHLGAIGVVLAVLVPLILMLRPVRRPRPASHRTSKGRHRR